MTKLSHSVPTLGELHATPPGQKAGASVGRKQLAVGDEATTFIDVRFVHRKPYAETRPSV
jgi:hypothetical protein